MPLSYPGSCRSWFTRLLLIAGVGVHGCALAAVMPGPAPVMLDARIDPRINDAATTRLDGNVRPEFTAANDRGALPDRTPLDHLQLLLNPAPERRDRLRAFIDALHDPKAPEFRQWLTAQRYGNAFGLSDRDLATLTTWLRSRGFVVNTVYPSGTLIDFSGTAGQVRDTFRTTLHQLDVDGETHFANDTDPSVPTAIAPAVLGVLGLNDFMPRNQHKARADYTYTNANTGIVYQAVVPADLATLYDFTPLFAKGISGQGQTIALIDTSNVYSAANWTTFRQVFGLSGYTKGSLTTVHPAPPSGTTNCADPGVNSEEAESTLDSQWATAAAPSATLILEVCHNPVTAIQNVVNGSAPPAIISLSWGECEVALGASMNAAISQIYAQAVTEGISVFVSSGDGGAAACDVNKTAATHGIGVNGYASTANDVAVGGTDFGDTYAGTTGTYWSLSDGSTFGSALSYVPEIPWNDSCASVLIATHAGIATPYGSAGFCNSSTGTAGYLTTTAGAGGPSGCATGAPTVPMVVGGSCAGTAKPSWQAGLAGLSKDTVRDLPDVALFSGNGTWGHSYLICDTSPTYNYSCPTTSPSSWLAFGGTSVATPIMAAIQALANQVRGSRQGNPNYALYTLAAAEYGASAGNPACKSSLGKGVASSCVFYDVTQGDIDVPCTGKNNCYLPSGTNGVLSTSKSAYLPAYGSTTGWDFATGLGSVNAYNLVEKLAGS